MALPSMRVGDVEVQGISDGILKTSLDLVIGMERAVADALVGGTADGSLYIPVNNFLIRRGSKTIMIDAGAATPCSRTLGKLPDNLRAAGVEPSAVTQHRDDASASRSRQRPGRRWRPSALPQCRDRRARDRGGFLDAPARRQHPDRIKATVRATAINLKPYLDRIRRVRRRRGVSGFCAGAGARPIRRDIPAGCLPRRVAASWRSAMWCICRRSRFRIGRGAGLRSRQGSGIQSRKRILDMAASERFAIAGAHVNAPGFWLRGAQGREFCLRAGGKLIAYSGLMLAALITLAHFSVSPTKCFSNSDGGPLSTAPPRSVIRVLSVGSASRR